MTHSAEAEVGADERLKDIFHLSALLPGYYQPYQLVGIIRAFAYLVNR